MANSGILRAMLKRQAKPPRVLISQQELATLPRSGLLRRLAALLYDMFLVVSMWILLGFPLQLLFGADANQVIDGEVVTNPTLSTLMFLMMVVSVTTFYTWFWRHTGQTLGMIAWRIKVIGIDDHPPTIAQCLIRFAAAWPAFWLFGLGYLWMYRDRDGDAVHEKLSGTKTVLLPKHARPF